VPFTQRLHARRRHGDVTGLALVAVDLGHRRMGTDAQVRVLRGGRDLRPGRVAVGLDGDELGLARLEILPQRRLGRRGPGAQRLERTRARPRLARSRRAALAPYPPAAYMRAGAARASFEHDQDLALLDHLTLLHPHLSDGAGPRRRDGDLHLHRLEDEQLVFLGHLRADLGPDLQTLPTSSALTSVMSLQTENFACFVHRRNVAAEI